MARPRREIDTSTYSGRFAVRLRALREKAGLSVAEVSEMTGIHKKSLYDWESGLREPSLNHYPILAKALKIKTRTLFPEE